jgi:hypothetical protein
MTDLERMKASVWQNPDCEAKRPIRLQKGKGFLDGRRAGLPRSAVIRSFVYLIVQELLACFSSQVIVAAKGDRRRRYGTPASHFRLGKGVAVALELQRTGALILRFAWDFAEFDILRWRANRSASMDGGVRSNPESVIVAISTALHRRRAT